MSYKTWLVVMMMLRKTALHPPPLVLGGLGWCRSYRTGSTTTQRHWLPLRLPMIHQNLDGQIAV